MSDEDEDEENYDVREFIAKYGERGYYLLKAILQASIRASGAKLGDFDLKTLKKVLGDYGLDYNPVPLLYTLERRLGVIRTTYRSSQQHWWEIVKRRDLERAVAEFEGREEDVNDYELRLLRIQFYSLEPDKVLSSLRAAERSGDRKAVKQLAFTVLPKVVEFLKAAKSKYADALSAEIGVAEEILDLAERIALKERSESPKRLVAEPEVDYNPL